MSSSHQQQQQQQPLQVIQPTLSELTESPERKPLASSWFVVPRKPQFIIPSHSKHMFPAATRPRVKSLPILPPRTSPAPVIVSRKVMTAVHRQKQRPAPTSRLLQPFLITQSLPDPDIFGVLGQRSRTVSRKTRARTALRKDSPPHNQHHYPRSQSVQLYK